MTMETIFGICVLRKLDDEEMTVRWPLVTCKIGPVFSIDARLGLSLLESFMDSRYICALIDLDVMRAPLRDDMLRKGEHLPGWIEWRFSSPPKENSDRFRQVIDNKRKYGGGGGSRTFPQPLEPATYTFYKEYEVPKVPLCRGYRTPIVHGGLFERPPLMSKPGPNCKAKGEVVEAGRIELPSEETNDRERSCFSHVPLCIVIDA
jgi:hypothetical protein